MTNKYLEILGLKAGATKKEIKAGYRRLAKKYHPDRNPHGREKFLEISEAYNFLMEAGPQSTHTSVAYGYDPDVAAYAEARRRAQEQAARAAQERYVYQMKGIDVINRLFHLVVAVMFCISGIFVYDFTRPTRFEEIGCALQPYSRIPGYALLVLDNGKWREIEQPSSLHYSTVRIHYTPMFKKWTFVELVDDSNIERLDLRIAASVTLVLVIAGLQVIAYVLGFILKHQPSNRLSINILLGFLFAIQLAVIVFY